MKLQKYKLGSKKLMQVFAMAMVLAGVVMGIAFAQTRGLASNVVGVASADTTTTCPGGFAPEPNTDPPRCPVTCSYYDPATKTTTIRKCADLPDSAVNNGNCANTRQCDLLNQYINPAINFVAALVGLAVTIGIIWGGIEYASAGGDPQKVGIAKNRIRNAIIALLTFFFLYALFNFITPGGLF